MYKQSVYTPGRLTYPVPYFSAWSQMIHYTHYRRDFDIYFQYDMIRDLSQYLPVHQIIYHESKWVVPGLS